MSESSSETTHESSTTHDPLAGAATALQNCAAEARAREPDVGGERSLRVAVYLYDVLHGLLRRRVSLGAAGPGGAARQHRRPGSGRRRAGRDSKSGRAARRRVRSAHAGLTKRTNAHERRRDRAVPTHRMRRTRGSAPRSRPSSLSSRSARALPTARRGVGRARGRAPPRVDLVAACVELEFEHGSRDTRLMADAFVKRAPRGDGCGAAARCARQGQARARLAPLECRAAGRRHCRRGDLHARGGHGHWLEAPALPRARGRFLRVDGRRIGRAGHPNRPVPADDELLPRARRPAWTRSCAAQQSSGRSFRNGKPKEG